MVRYASWDSAVGLGAKVAAFVDGSSNFLQTIAIPPKIAVAIMGVLVASFAGTTLDTACRLQRYVVQELAGTLGGKSPLESQHFIESACWLTNKHCATIFAVTLALFIASLPKGQPTVGLNDALGGTIPADYVAEI